MEFMQALKILNIEDYSSRIIESNSHGELFHLDDYIFLAKLVNDAGESSWFRPWFEWEINYANKYWDRPSSIYQHIKEKLITQIERGI